MTGTAHLVPKLLSGSGLRVMEAVRLRVKDIDEGMKQLTVRSGKGSKDRFPPFPATLTPLAGGKTLPQPDLMQGHGAGSLPQALARKYPTTAKEWGWQYGFPARRTRASGAAGSRRLHGLVYAQHGRKLMGLKSPVREPPYSPRENTGSTSRRQLREGDRPWEGSRRAKR